jgi:hypothetical protein
MKLTELEIVSRNPVKWRSLVDLEAMELESSNIELFEQWSGGSQKGIKLPRSERHVDIQTIRGEVSVYIGDWALKLGPRDYVVYSDQQFRERYVE